MSSIKKRLVQDLFNSHTKKRHALEGLKFRLRGSTRCTCSGILDGPERRGGGAAHPLRENFERLDTQLCMVYFGAVFF